MSRPRIYEVAKEMGVKSTELLDLLKDIDPDAKNHMSTLTDLDMDIILEHYTKKFDDGSQSNPFAKEDAAPAVQEAASEKAAAPAAQEAPKPVQPQKERVVKAARYVDTRPSTVDLDKLDTEKIEELSTVEMKDTETTKQKIKKGPHARQNNRRKDDTRPQNKEKEKKKSPRKFWCPTKLP